MEKTTANENEIKIFQVKLEFLASILSRYSDPFLSDEEFSYLASMYAGNSAAAWLEVADVEAKRLLK